MMSPLPLKRYFGKNGSPGNMFLASLFLHLVLMAAVFATVPGSSKPLTFGAPYSVSLVGPEVIGPGSQEAPDQKSLLKTISSDSSVILKREIGASPSSFVMKKDDSGRSDIEKAIRALEQKETAAGKNKIRRRLQPLRNRRIAGICVPAKRLQPFCLGQSKKKLVASRNPDAQKECRSRNRSANRPKRLAGTHRLRKALRQQLF